MNWISNENFEGENVTAYLREQLSKLRTFGKKAELIYEVQANKVGKCIKVLSIFILKQKTLWLSIKSITGVELNQRIIYRILHYYEEYHLSKTSNTGWWKKVLLRFWSRNADKFWHWTEKRNLNFSESKAHSPKHTKESIITRTQMESFRKKIQIRNSK